jgi:outer membrane protein assembly factor BamD
MPVRLVLAVLVLALPAACASKPKLSADEYYKEATAAFEAKDYEGAINRYKELLDQHPFSGHAEEAELRIARSYYNDKRYPEAITALNDFQRMHPMSPHVALVYYLLGKSYMDQMSTIDRDQAASENAHGWFRVVIDRYPESSYATKARRRLAECRAALADHELYIAAYYFKRKNLRAGENRVKGILENYPETPVAGRALEALAAAYARAGDGEHERMARAALAELGTSDTGNGPPSGQEAAAPGGVQEPLSGPANAALLADMVARHGPAAGVSTAATAPALLDPVKPTVGKGGDPRYGPQPGTEPDRY